jgi:hypothetical protein
VRKHVAANGVGVERLDNGQRLQRLRRRPPSADASARTTRGFFPSHTFGLTGTETVPKTRGSSSQTTPNGDHVNRSAAEQGGGEYGAGNGASNGARNGANHGSPNGSLNGSAGGETAPATGTPAAKSTARETVRATAQPTARRTVRGKSRGLSGWELPELVRPLPVRKQTFAARPRRLVHYPAVVEYVWQSRFATADQVQRRFSMAIGSLRTAQYQLAALVRLGYLRTAPVRSTSPNFPYVYFATQRGMRLVRTAYEQLGERREPLAGESVRSRGMALASLLHELLLTEFELAVEKTLANRGDLVKLFSERRYFARDKQLRYAGGGRTRVVIPDAGFLLGLRQTSGRPDACRFRSLLMHFVEFDNGTMPLPRLAAKLRQYDGWSRSAEADQMLAQLGERYGGGSAPVNWRLVLVVRSRGGCADRLRLVDTLIETAKLSSAMRDRVWLATASKLAAHQRDPAPLAPACWVRGRDVRGCLTGSKQRGEGCAESPAASRRKELRALVVSRLALAPRHALFPTPSQP